MVGAQQVGLRTAVASPPERNEHGCRHLKDVVQSESCTDATLAYFNKTSKLVNNIASAILTWTELLRICQSVVSLLPSKVTVVSLASSAHFDFLWFSAQGA